jgi:hypothetical protein
MILMANSSVDGFKVAVESARLIVGGSLAGDSDHNNAFGSLVFSATRTYTKPISKMYRMYLILLLQIGLWLLPMSMLSVFTGEVSDGWGGTLGYMWIGSCLTTEPCYLLHIKHFRKRAIRQSWLQQVCCI